MKIPFISKKIFKKRNKCCKICGEKEYKLLDVHRWKEEGKDGGKYDNTNCLCVCVKCHRLIHTKDIQIMGIYNSTGGEVVHFIDKLGEEHFNEI